MEKKEILQKYGNCNLEFNCYSKYVFTFSGVAADGTQILANLGGSPEDIYRLNVEANEKVTLKSLFADYVTLTKDGKK
jgi:hypothetical protein